MPVLKKITLETSKTHKNIVDRRYKFRPRHQKGEKLFFWRFLIFSALLLCDFPVNKSKIDSIGTKPILDMIPNDKGQYMK